MRARQGVDKARRLAVAAIAFTALAAAACGEPGQERVVDLVVPVTVQPVTTGTIESVVESTGSLRPFREAELIAEIKGDLFFESADGDGRLTQGSWVEQDQLVARLESLEWEVSVRLESRQMAVANAQRTLADKQALFEEGLGLETDVETARKALEDAETDLENAEIQLEKMNVSAPISGHLTELTDVTESTLVQQGDIIGKVVDYRQVLVDLKIPNSQMQAVRVGQLVRVTNYALPDQVFEGRVSVIDPALEAATRTFRAVVVVDNPDLALRPGMFVKVEIVTEAHRNVILIPRELILIRENRDVVFVETEGRAEMRPIVAGLEDDTHVEVLEGLEEGERLITSNYETLRSRTPVRVTGQSGPE